jgi:hypothetical protein
VKKTKTKSRPIRDHDISGSGPLDWTPLFHAFREAFEWALDVAAGLARDYREEVEAVERVREFMRARLAGEPANLSVDDVLFTFALIIVAIERDLAHTLGPVHPFRLPGASELWEPAWLRRLVSTYDRSTARTRGVT